jgi:hypothetical protein
MRRAIRVGAAVARRTKSFLFILLAKIRALREAVSLPTPLRLSRHGASHISPAVVPRR